MSKTYIYIDNIEFPHTSHNKYEIKNDHIKSSTSRY